MATHLVPFSSCPGECDHYDHDSCPKWCFNQKADKKILTDFINFQQDVRAFFESWGIYPSEEDTGDLNKEVIDHGINRRCYERMIENADKHISTSKFPGFFGRFCGRMINAQDDAFYLRVTTWDDLETAWDEYISSL